MKTTTWTFLLSTMLGALLLLLGPHFVFASDMKTYEVKVTNITKGQTFTPILVAAHRAGVKLFTLGSPASVELEQLAEGGNVAPLTEALLADSRVGDVTNSEGLLHSGASVSIWITVPDDNKYLSLAAMLVPTNDAFMGVNGMLLPKGKKVKTFTVLAYDAGTELNDEYCKSIPGGGGCAGEGYNPNGGEGFVHIHSGIHSVGDLSAADFDWANPIAHVMIKRVRD